MKRIKIFGFSIPFYLLLITMVSATLLISGIVYASVNILQRYDFGYTKIGESKSVTILQTTNSSASKDSINISTTCNGTQAINAVLLYNDPSGVARTQPLILEGTTTFFYDFAGKVNLTINSVQAGQWSCQLSFNNDTTTFMNFLEVLP